MKPTSHLDKLPSAQDACTANGHPAGPQPDDVRDRHASSRWLLGVVSIMAAAFIWACWSFVHASSTPSPKPMPAVIGSLALVLLALAAMVATVFWARQMLLQNTRLAEINVRLAKERDLMRTIIDNLPDCIYAKNQQGRFVLNNLAHAKDLGAASPEALRGKSDFDFFPPDLAKQFHADEQKIVTTGESVINQEQYKSSPRDPSGKKTWSFSSKVIWRDQRGDILGTVGITRNIHEFKLTQEALRQSEEKLRQSAAQLEHSNRELQDFAYVASHDLQEPLRKIVVFGGRLVEKCGGLLAAEPRDYLERMQKAAARMQTLINDLLAFSRVTIKARPFAPVNLAEVAHAVVDDLEARIEQVGGRVEIGELMVIDSEELQLRQLLQNLVGNALKFSKPGEPPVVKVAARKFADPAGRELCELTVSDNGIGFEEKYLDRIFNVFQRLHTRTEYEGNGMGLAIVKKIALYHGGDITAKSRPGSGTTFIVTLPATQPKDHQTEKGNYEN